jgi:hypothetical protein
MSLDAAGAIAGFLLTLAVLSYVIGDNPVYRIAVHLFVGVTAGYVTVVAAVGVLFPQLIVASLDALQAQPPRWGQLGLIGVGALLSFLLILKMANADSALGRFPVAYLVGLGAAVAAGGALTGTLFPQTQATFVSLLPGDAAGGDLLTMFEQPVSAIVLVGGTVCTLAFFWYGGRTLPGGQVDRPLLVKPLARIGQVFIGIALGVMYAGVLSASVAYLAERLGALWQFISQPPLGG